MPLQHCRLIRIANADTLCTTNVEYCSKLICQVAGRAFDPHGMKCHMRSKLWLNLQCGGTAVESPSPLQGLCLDCYCRVRIGMTRNDKDSPREQPHFASSEMLSMSYD